MKLNFTCGGTVKEFAQEYVKIASLMILAVENKITKLEMYEQMKESPVCPLTHREVWEMFLTKDKWSLGAFCWVVDRPFISASIPERVGPIRKSPSTSPYIGTCVRSNIQFCKDTPSGSSEVALTEETVIPTQLAHSDTSLATDVYPEYEKARNIHKAAFLKWRKLAEDKQNESEIAVRTQWESTLFFIARIQPNKVGVVRYRKSMMLLVKRGDRKEERDFDAEYFIVTWFIQLLTLIIAADP